ncbi:hypothetical protein HanPSC8_Chr09g0395091 [Helianthus annuus]|nr:hypothetical protein HanPSC8_Chr09g0395091 [Helianthus annuus]
MMSLATRGLAFLLAIALLVICARISEALVTIENGLKTMVYLLLEIEKII